MIKLTVYVTSHTYQIFFSKYPTPPPSVSLYWPSHLNLKNNLKQEQILPIIHSKNPFYSHNNGTKHLQNCHHKLFQPSFLLMAIHHCTLKPLTYQVEQTVRLIMSWHGFHCLKVNFKGFLSKIVKKISNYDNHSEDLFKSKSLWAKKVLQTFGFPSWAKMRPRLYFIDVTVLGRKQMSQLHYIHMIHSMDHSCFNV